MKTKQFSKKKKVMSWALAVATPLTFVAPAMMSKTIYADISNASASTETATTIEVTSKGQGTSVSFTGYKSKYQVKEKEANGYKLPTPMNPSNKASLVGDSSLEVSVKKSNGEVITNKLAPVGGAYYLAANSSVGSYIVTYTFTSGSGENEVVTAKDFVVTIEESYKSSIVFDKNSEYIIPSSIAKGQTLRIPFPTASYKGKEVGSLTQSNVVLSDGTDSRALTLSEDGKYLSYTVLDSDVGKTLTITYSGTLNIEGTEYNLTQQKKTIKVVESQEKRELSYSVGSVALSNVDLKVGKMATLPAPKVLDKNGDEVTDVYTIIKVKDANSNEETVTDFKFMPKAAGKYFFEYITKGFNSGEEVSANFGMLEATYAASSTISIYATADYDLAKVDDIELDNLLDLTNSIPKTLYVGDASEINLKLPAIFAVSDKNLESFGMLQLTRSVKYTDKDGNEVVVIYEGQSEEEGTDTKIKANKAASVKLTLGGENGVKVDDNGNYVVEISYNAEFVNSKGEVVTGDKTSKTQTYELTIKVDSISPTLTVDDLVVSDVNIGEKVTFSDPKITSKVSDADGAVTFDESPQVEVTYVYLKKKDGADDEYEEISSVKNLNKSSSKYTIDTADAPGGAEKLKITYKVTDDADFQGVAAKVTPIEKTINLNKPSTDATAPQFKQGEQEEITWHQVNTTSDKIELINIDASDDSSADATNNGPVSLTAYITNSKGEVVDTIQATSYEATKAYINGKSFTPGSAGDYTVTYVATDQAGNCAVASEKFSVNFVEAYATTIDQIPTAEYNDSINLLEYIYLADSTGSVAATDSAFTGNIYITNQNFADETALQTFFTDKSITIDNSKKYLVIYLDGENSYTIDTSSSTFGKIITRSGEIKVRAWGIQNGKFGAGSNLVTFSSKDTTSPTFTITNEDLNDTHLNFENDKAEYTLPWFDNVTDSGIGVDINTAKITWNYADDSSSNTITYAEYKKYLDSTETDKTNPLKITFTKQGKVSVKYSIADLAGNVRESSSYTIHVGDTDAPVIDKESVEKAITAPTTAKDDGKIVINLKDIKVSEGIDATSDSLTYTIKRDGKEIDSDDINKLETGVVEITAATAGEYVITFTATDAAKNKSNAVTQSYTVESPKAKTTNSTTIWGTVLIVVALIILALVIFFFTKSSKSKSKPVELKTEKKKDNDKKAE